MKLKMGRIGMKESVCLASVSLCIGGVFGLDPEFAYSRGNSTYLTLPASILLASLAALFLVKAAEKTKSRDLAELLENALGKTPAKLFAVPVIFGFFVCAVRPMTAFLEVLHRLVYDGVSYTAIMLYVFPVTVFLAWKGFESLGRTAVVFSALMLLALVFATVSAIPDYEASRLFPIMGEGAGRAAVFTLSELVFFIPPFLSLLVNAEGLSGLSFVKRTVVRSALISAAVCGVTQLCVSLVYPYGILSGLLMPLYRLNFLSPTHSYVLRLDKLFIMIWLNGCIISAAYCVYTSSLLWARLFRQRDVTPAVASFSLIAASAVLMKSGKSFGFVSAANGLVARYGAALVLLPPAALGAACLIKYRKGKA